MRERWKPLDVILPGCEISNTGQVRQRVKLVHGVLQYNVLLKPVRNPKGLFYIPFAFEGEQQNRFIHRMVAEAFLRNPGKCKFVRHKSRNLSNNGVDNLEWCKTMRKRAPKYKLGSLDVLRIRTRGRKRGAALSLAIEYDLPVHHIRRIINGTAC